MALGGLLGPTHQVLKIDTTAGAGALLVLGAEGREYLSRMPEFSVELVGALNMLGRPREIDVQTLLGTRANLQMDVGGDKRDFNGFIVRMQIGERHGRYESYSITLRPWLWFLTRRKNSRVFQGKTVKQIVTEVLGEYSTHHEFRLMPAPPLPELDYCVQYDETDFDFVSRLLEEAGICYFFEHTSDTHTMVMADAMAKHKSKKSKKAITWSNSLKHEESMIHWRSQREVRSQKAVVMDHDYLATATAIQADKLDPHPTAKLGTLEVFEFPGLVVQNGKQDTARPASSAATQRAKVLLEGLTSMQKMSTGTTNCRDVTVGATFAIEDCPKSGDDGFYLVVGANYSMEFADHEAVEDLKTIRRRRDGFLCELVAMPMTASNFRPERSTGRPVMRGPQTATVVGSSGNEIETDKHGRVKIQFPWDRLGEKNQNSSCWVRVAQPWAGKGFGLWTLPRVGDEVVVSFIDGHPDRPIITGSVYNDVNPVPYKLPDLATVSGIKSRTSKEGTADTANELRFDDAKDAEYVWLQAQKDFYRLVRKSAFDFIGENETLKVKLTRKEVIGENWYLDVGKDVMQHIGKDLHLNVAADMFFTGGATFQLKITKDLSVEAGGDASVKVTGKTDVTSTGDLKVSSDGNVHVKAAQNLVQEGGQKLSLKAGADLLGEGMSIKLKGGTTIALEAATTITLKAGASFISIGPAGVDISGPMVKINSGGSGGSAGPATAATAASPTAPTEAKKQADIAPDKATDYDKLFEDPIKRAAT